MKRTFSSLLLAGLLLGGCAPSADPLDWKIEGRHLPDLQESLDHHLALMPPELAQEFAFCFSNVKADILTDRSGTVQDQENRVCRHLRDKTVREILIEGTELAQRATFARLTNESQYLLRLINDGDQLPEAQRASLPARIERTQASIAHLKEVLEKCQHRLAELRPPAAKS